MLKSAVIVEKKFKHSPCAGADKPLGPKFLCQQEGLIRYVYSRRSGAVNPRGENFYVKRNLLSLLSFATSFKKISLKSDFIHFFHDFIHVNSPGAGADNPLGLKFDVSRTSCHFSHLLQVSKKSL